MAVEPSSPGEPTKSAWWSFPKRCWASVCDRGFPAHGLADRAAPGKVAPPGGRGVVLEEVPDISYEDVGGLDSQIEAITDAVELPFLHRELFIEHRLPAPKGILLYGPPGCGKTLIAKAVANSLAKKVAEVSGDRAARSYFLNIKGPSYSINTSGKRSGRFASYSSGLGRKVRRAFRSSSSSMRWTPCSAPEGRASLRTWSRPSSLSCWLRSTASRH